METEDDLFGPGTRAEQIYARFKEFHRANPMIWILFKKFTQQLIAAGRVRYSGDAIYQRIRWHVDVETKGEPVKINDHYKAYYVRMFLAKYPQHKDFFSVRKRTSEERGPYDCDIAVYNVGAAGDESILMQQLRAL